MIDTLGVYLASKQARACLLNEQTRVVAGDVLLVVVVLVLEVSLGDLPSQIQASL